ncbi:MAG: Bax inhibitor-1/YccA family protein [Candidatus Eremiobacteraeota bacterium]|nr:Bax inhibitor-1/YccA family protein [Candidatus Eremiobacteraeota bacterium]
MSQFERNHDGAALGASHQVPLEDQRSVYPYTVRGEATMPDHRELLRRQNMIHTTYLYLAVAVFGCMAGAYWGSHSEGFLKFMFSSSFLFLGALIVLNFVPRLALQVAEKNPRMAVPALAGVGGVSGLCLAPLVFLGLRMSGQAQGMDGGGNLVSTAIVITGAMFAAVTAYVHINKTQFKMRPAMTWGLFGFILVAIPANLFLQSSIFGIIISGLAGMLGVYQLAAGTSLIVTNRNFNSPAAGALVLFAGVFNLFQSVLSLLIAGGRD